jgi:hypothetical protein
MVLFPERGRSTSGAAPTTRRAGGSLSPSDSAKAAAQPERAAGRTRLALPRTRADRRVGGFPVRTLGHDTEENIE